MCNKMQLTMSRYHASYKIHIKQILSKILLYRADPAALLRCTKEVRRTKNWRSNPGVGRKPGTEGARGNCYTARNREAP
jgi:hypothetical protein